MRKNMTSLKKKQMLQQWPICLMFSNSKDRSLQPNHYTRVPAISRSGTTTSSIVSDCASNATLATNASPFNSQIALVGERDVSKRNQSSSLTIKSEEESEVLHYYAGNLLNNQNYKKSNSEIYNKHNNNNNHQHHRHHHRHEHHIRKENRNKKKDNNNQETNYEHLNPLLSQQNQTETRKMFSSQEFQVKMEAGPPFQTYFQTERPPKKRTTTHYQSQILAALSVSLGSLVVGFASSYTSPALPSMKLDGWLGMTTQAASWIGSVMPLSALFGGIAGGPMIEYLGRRNTILATGLPFIAAWLLIGFATNIAMILLGRILSGFCVGVASLALPVYLGETIQPEVRGTLGLLPTAFGNVGILICFIVGKYLNWSHLAILGACLPVPFMILIFLIPETPRWYIAKGNKDNARKSLQWLRGKTSDVNDEMSAIEKAHAESERNSSKGALKELLTNTYTKSLLISLGLMAFQQLSGINAVIFYTVEIFKDAGSTIDGNDCTIIVGVVNFLSTFMATVLIDRLGRKILLYISSVSMMTTLFTLGTFFYFKQHLKYNVDSFGWIPLVSFVIYVIGFSLGFGPIPWLMMGEILPAKIRGSAASVVTAFNWSCTFIVTKTFTDIIDAIGSYGTFWLFSFITLMGLIFVIIFVPETKGRSLEEIEMKLTCQVRRTSAVANLKPLPTAC